MTTHRIVFDDERGEARIISSPDEVKFIDSSERASIDKVFCFGVLLREAGLMPPDEDEYWERPWKWQPEYEAWVGAGRPQPDDADWARFLREVNP